MAECVKCDRCKWVDERASFQGRGYRKVTLPKGQSSQIVDLCHDCVRKLERWFDCP